MKMPSAIPALLGLLAAAALAGCGGGKEKRSSVSFHADGVRQNIERVRDQLTRTHNPFAMQSATDALYRALEGLPVRIERKATERVQQRKAKAQEALAFFVELRKTLDAMTYDQAEANAKLDELAKIIDGVEQ